MNENKSQHYDIQYQTPNYFKYNEWLYDRYVSSLIHACGLRKGATVLDIGCGQGLFSYLFHKHGMKVSGIDMSEAGIQMAGKMYGHLGIKFTVADIKTATFTEQFDCVFVRSCSLYNRSDLLGAVCVTEDLLRFVGTPGVLLVLYNSNFSKRVSKSWQYHSWDDFRSHFAGFPTAQLYFSIKIDSFVLGRHAYRKFITTVNMIVSKVLGIGGDLICILKK